MIKRIKMYYLFNCGQVNCNDWTLRNKNIIDHAELNKILYNVEEHFLQATENQQQNFFQYVMSHETAILSLPRLVSCMDKKMKQLCRYEKFNEFTSNSSLYDLNFHEIRQSICEFIVYICTYLDSINWSRHFIQQTELTKSLSDFHITIRKYLSRLYKLPESLLNYAVSNTGNNCPHPGYHIYHLHLELRRLYIILLYSRLKCENEVTENEELNNAILMILYDLVYLAMKIFIKRNLICEELKTRSPYICICMREMWLMMQILISDMNSRGYTKTFWDFVNIVLNNILDKNVEKKLCWLQESEKVQIDIKCPEIFALWIIYHVNLLYGYQSDGSYSILNNSKAMSNHTKLEELLKSYLSKAVKDDNTEKELCAIMPLLNILINDWWEPDTKVIKHLVDYFHSHINHQYFQPMFGPWNIAFDNQSPQDILNQVKNRVLGTESNKESSFSIFLRLMGRFLYQNKLRNEQKYYKQIKGRIMIKFNNIQFLSDDGFYNFLLMLLTLAIYADPVDVSHKIISIPLNFAESSQKKFVLSYKAKLAVILLYNELGYNFKELKLNEVKENFMNEINQISVMKATVHLMRHYIDILNVIITSNPKFDRNEHILFDGWIDRFLPTCPKNIFILLTDMICLIINQCQQQNYTNHPILDALWSNVPSRVRQMALDNNLSEDSDNIIKLAVAFTLEALRNPAIAERHKHSAISLYTHFGMSIMIKNIKIIEGYTSQIISNTYAVERLKQKNPKFEQTVIQTWIRVSILKGDEETDHLKCIKNFLINMTEIREIFVSSNQAQLFRNSNTPFLSLLTSLMEKRKSVQNIYAFDEKWRSYFQKIEKWAFMTITKENVESPESSRIYKCISFIIFYCSPVFFLKNQPQNMLKTLITTAMLPIEEKAYLKTAGKKIFSMVILGLESLNAENYPHILSLVQNLFDQYLPLLVTAVGNNFAVNEILLNCFSEVQDSYLKFLFSILSNFIQLSNLNTTHKHCYLVLIFFTHLVQDKHRCTKSILHLIISKCLAPVIKCFLSLPERHPHKKQTSDLFRAISLNHYFINDSTIRKDFEDIVIKNVCNSITVSISPTFALLNCIITMSGRIILNFLPRLQEIVQDSEKNRRPYAKSLKLSFHKLTEEIKQKSR